MSPGTRVGSRRAAQNRDQRDCAAKRDWIEHPYRPNLVGDDTVCRNARDSAKERAETDQAECAPKHRTEHLAALGAQSHPNPDFPGLARNHVAIRP